MAGLSLKFGCRAEELKKINGMASLTSSSTSLAAYKTIWVPVRPNSGPQAPEASAERSSGGDAVLSSAGEHSAQEAIFAEGDAAAARGGRGEGGEGVASVKARSSRHVDEDEDFEITRAPPTGGEL